MQKYNLHTHSFYCGHGKGSIREYAEEALEKGLGLLGFTEHLPFPDDKLSRTRMPYSAKKEYEEDVKRVRDEYREKGLEILLGWECDYFSSYKSYFEDVKAESDYIICGTHYKICEDGLKSLFNGKLTQSEVLNVAERTAEAASTRLFDFIAHPDVFFIGYEDFDSTAERASRIIIEESMKSGAELEINGNGLIRPSLFLRPAYPVKDFWMLARSMGIDKAVCSSDAHSVENLTKSFPLMDEFIKSVDIKRAEPYFSSSLKFRNPDQK